MARGYSMWRSWIVVLAALSSAFGAPWQQEQSKAPAASESTDKEITARTTDAAIKVRVNLVLVRVVVRDSEGKAVPGLKQEDFQIFDNGKRQKVSAFSVETAETEAASAEKENAGIEIGGGAENKEPIAGHASAMPQRFLALVFDDLHMKTADAMAVHEAAEKLFQSLTPTDRVAIYSTQGNVQQDFTGDAKTLRKTLKEIVAHPSKGEGQHECPNMSYYQADLIANKHDMEAMTVAAVDADLNGCPTDIETMAERILRAGDSVTRENYEYLDNIVNRLAAMPGQRVLVYISPGFISTDSAIQNTAAWIMRAVRAGVVADTIDARGLYTADVMPDIDAPPQAAPYRSSTLDYQAKEGTYRVQAQFESGQVLAGIAAGTGGRFFHNRNDLDVAMSQALAAPEVSYVLGFTPPQPFVEGKFHNLKVKLAKGMKYQIQATNGYYTSQKSTDPEDAAKEEVRETLFSRDEMASLDMELKAEASKVEAPSSQLSVLAHLDVKGLRFRKVDGRNYDELVWATGLFDGNGRLVDGQMKEVTLKLEDSTLEKMRQSGLTLKTVFTPKPGTYRVRSVLRSSEGNGLTARNLTTVISGAQPKKNASFQDIKWAPPNVDAPLKSLSLTPPCDLSELLEHTGASALALAENLEKFTAQERIDYVMLDHVGMVEDYDSGLFYYVYSIEQHAGGSISREYRTPTKDSHTFPAAGQHIGGAATALMFLPDLQTDYEMKCEGTDERNGQPDWVVHFQQRKDRPSRTATVWVSGVNRAGMLKGRAWIAKDNFQIVHLESSLMDGVPEIELEGLGVSVDYRPVQSPSSNLELWLPSHIATYWEYQAHRAILEHRFSDFQFFTVDTQEKTEAPAKP